MKSLRELGITKESIKETETSFLKEYEKKQKEKAIQDNRYLSDKLSILKAKKLDEAIKNSSILSKLLDKKDRDAMESLQIQLEGEKGSKTRRDLTLEEKVLLNNIKRGITKRKFAETRKHKIQVRQNSPITTNTEGREELELNGEATNLEVINKFNIETVNKLFKTVSEDKQRLIDRLKEVNNKDRDIF